jgi:hypothetical protein
VSFFFASDLSFPAFPHAAVIFFSLTFDGLTPHACTFALLARYTDLFFTLITTSFLVINKLGRN